MIPRRIIARSVPAECGCGCLVALIWKSYCTPLGIMCLEDCVWVTSYHIYYF